MVFAVQQVLVVLATRDQIVGQPLTRIFKLDEDEFGEMPLLAALAARQGFTGQPA